MLPYLSLVLKSSLKRQKYVSVLFFSNARFEFLVKLSMHRINCFVMLAFCMHILQEDFEHSQCHIM